MEIPELKRLEADALVDMEASNCPDSFEDGDASVSDDCQVAIINRNVLRSAISDWESFLVEHDATTEKAINGELQGIEPHTWFDHFRQDAAAEDKKYLPREHPAGLAPKKLIDSAQRLRGSSPSSADLERINQIKFDGGGAEFRYEVKAEMLQKHTKEAGPPRQNMEQHTQLNGWTSIDSVTTGLKFDLEVRADLEQHGDYHHTRTDGDGDSTAIGFVLSDPNAGDVFDVNIYIDPVYKTFIFETFAGRSKCPVEGGTQARERPHIVLENGPNAAGHPDEPLIFEVSLSNRGTDSSAFQLFTDHRSNPNLIGHLANGDTLTVPQQYDRIEPGQTINTLIAIERGPATFDNPGIPILFRSACENVLNIGDGNLAVRNDKVETASVIISNVADTSFPEGQQERLRFAEPCESIQLAGSLGSDKTFNVNRASENDTGGVAFTVSVTVHNPDSYKHKYSEAVNERLSRLQEVGLWYRRVGSYDWHRALYRPAGESDSVPINFATLGEDAFGYINVAWDVETLGDGQYEVEARTVCSDPTGTLPADFNFASTERIAGTIDRIEPELFGAASPPEGVEIFPGTPIRFEFTESISCTKPHTFQIVVTVEGMPDRVFDNTINNNIHVICEDRVISFNFDPFNVDFVELMGQSATVEIRNVQDLSANPIDPLKALEHDIQFAIFDPNDIETIINIGEGDRESDLSPEATSGPTGQQTADPTEEPTGVPTASPSASTTEGLTASPTSTPTGGSTVAPTGSPTDAPIFDSTLEPTIVPTVPSSTSITDGPTESAYPSEMPTSPTGAPTTSSESPSPTEQEVVERRRLLASAGEVNEDAAGRLQLSLAEVLEMPMDRINVVHHMDIGAFQVRFKPVTATKDVNDGGVDALSVLSTLRSMDLERVFGLSSWDSSRHSKGKQPTILLGKGDERRRRQQHRHQSNSDALGGVRGSISDVAEQPEKDDRSSDHGGIQHTPSDGVDEIQKELHDLKDMVAFERTMLFTMIGIVAMLFAVILLCLQRMLQKAANN